MRHTEERSRILCKGLLRQQVTIDQFREVYGDQYAREAMQWFVKQGMAELSGFGTIRIVPNKTIETYVAGTEDELLRAVWTQVARSQAVENAPQDAQRTLT